MNDDFKIYLKAIINDSSLSDVEKKLAKERLKISADIDLKDFAKNKADIEKQFQSLAGIIKNILGDAVSDRQATQWAKQYYKEIESGAKQVAKEQANIYTTAQKELKKLYDLKIQYAKLGSNKDTDYYYGNAIKKQEETYRQARANTSKPETWDFQKRLDLEREELILQDKLAKAMDTTATSAQNLSQNSKIQFAIDTEKYTAEIFAIQQQLNKFGIQSGEIFQTAQTSLTKLDAAYNGMKESDGDKRLEYEKEYQKYLETTKNLLKQITSQKSNELIPQGDNRRLTFIKQLNDYLLKNTAMASRSKEEIQGWINTLESADDMTRGSFDNLKQNFQTLDSQLRSTGKLGLSWTDKFKQAAAKFGGWALATGSVMELWNQLRRIPEEVYKIDTAMTNLYKVTDETDRKYDQFLDNASQKAQEIGRSVSSLVDQSADWAKLGFSIDEASKLAETSSIYANVGEVDDATAVADLVTAMKSFNIEASDSITIVDSLNKLGNEFATDAKSLGEGLRTSASALNLAGNDINQSLAMLTGGTEITQNASEMGNALKVLSMRLRGMKGELEALGEEYENVESISKIQTQILNQTKGAVNIFDSKGNFKSTYEILKDISEVWSEISQVDQAALLETIAGKQRGNQISALIQSFQSGQVEKAYAASLNSAGSAMQEQERWLESLQAKLQQLDAAFQSLSMTILDSDFLKTLTDSGIAFVNILNTIIDKAGILTPLLSGGAIAAFIKNFDWPCNKGCLKIA